MGQACEEHAGACGRGLWGRGWRTELWAPPSTHLEVGPCPLLESGWAVAVKDTRLASSAVAPWPCCPHPEGYPSPPPAGSIQLQELGHSAPSRVQDGVQVVPLVLAHRCAPQTPTVLPQGGSHMGILCSHSPLGLAP